MKLTDVVLNILFPRVCIGCGKFGNYICPSCLRDLKKHICFETICPVCTKPSIGGVTHPFCKTRYTPDGYSAFFRYRGVIRKAIKMIKYRRVIDISKELGEVCTGVAEEFRDSFIPLTSFIKNFRPRGTSIPLHETRQRSRWFNQSEILGKRIASIWNMPFDEDILKRISFSKPQAGLSKIDRIQNIKDSFRINANIKNNAYIVFDDVWTTGATMREAVRVLKHGGARNVWCVTLAR